MTGNRIKKILYMGCYEKDINRNIIFLKGLQKNNVEVYEYNVNSHNIIKNIFSFFKNLKRLKKQNFDLILFHSEAFIQFILVKILSYTKRVLLIHDIFISKLQTIYDDRKQLKKRGLPKVFLRILLFTMDLIECTFSDYLILDTFSHIKFFHDKFNIPIKKFRRVLVGSQDDILFPLEKKTPNKEKFIVGFCGTYIPLQGIKYIIQSAKILENDKQIEFHLIGKGQTYKKNRTLAMELRLKNIKFFDIIPIEEVPRSHNKFDIALGIFGDTAKTLQVIPTKIFDGIAMKIPMITSDTPAIRELFEENKDIILCEPANPESLSQAILKLKNDENLRSTIKENAYALFKKKCSLNAIGKSLKTVLNDILKKQNR